MKAACEQGRRRLAAALLLSGALHGALLAVLAEPGGWRGAPLLAFSERVTPLTVVEAPAIAVPRLEVRLSHRPVSSAVLTDAVAAGLTFAASDTSDTATGRALQAEDVASATPGLSTAMAVAAEGTGGSGAAGESAFGLLPAGESGPPYPPPEGRFVSARLCESPPQPLAAHELDFPELQAIEFAGVITFALLIDERGRITEVLHESGTLDGRIVAPVVDRLRGFRFLPAICHGQPAATRLRIEVSFGYTLTP